MTTPEGRTKRVGPGRYPVLEPTPKVLAQIYELGAIHCQMDEVAAVLGVARVSLYRFFDRCPEARESWRKGKAEGKIGLRRGQVRMAETEPSMSRWLGKQWLGQTDKKEVELTGAGGGPLKVASIDYTALSIEELRTLNELAERVRPPKLLNPPGDVGPGDDPEGDGGEEPGRVHQADVELD